MNIKDVLSRLKGVKKISGGYQARCPCHKDDKASLSISEGRKQGIVLCCHAGCRTEDIIAALGLKMKDICSESTEEAYTWEYTWEYNIPDLEAVYDYGKYVKLRCKGKNIRYGHIINGKFINGMPKGVEKCLYRKENLYADEIYIVEGEKDCDNMIEKGFSCVTMGGCGDWKKNYKRFAPLFRGKKVIILADNDEPGRDVAEQIAKDLKNFAFSVKKYTPCTAEKGADVSDYFERGGTADGLRAILSDVNIKPRYAPYVDNSKDKIRINGGLLAQCIQKGADYVILKQHGFDVADFYFYENGVYRQKGKSEVKALIKSYVPAPYQTDNLLNNVYNLLSADEEKIKPIDAADTGEKFINFRNGIYDIKSGEFKTHSEFYKENKGYISILQLNCKYDPGAKCKRWENFIRTFCSDDEGNVDEEKIAVLQEWFGFAISGIKGYRPKKCLAIHSPIGDTGKSKYLNIIVYALGEENAAHVAIQNLPDRFATGRLAGKRVNSVGDQKASDLEDSSVFKTLTGGDVIDGEIKGKMPFQYRYNGVLQFACNSLPSFRDDKGGHMFSRFLVIKSERHISEKERDTALEDKLKAEIDGIVQWALIGLKRLCNNGLKFSRCRSSDEAINEYRSRMDTFYSFLNECGYTVTGNKADRIKKSDLEKHYMKYCEENDIVCKQKNIKDKAERNGIAMITLHGTKMYAGVKSQGYSVERLDGLSECPF